jgi:hypothetical protein
MGRRLTLTSVAGPLGILVYLCFTIVSFTFFSGPFNPRDNWLSDLGNGAVNPSGALLYRLGCVLTGVLVISLFAGLYAVARGRTRKVRIFLGVAQGFGALSGAALVLTGIFSLGAHASHSFWSAVLYISFGTAVFFYGWAFLFLPSFSRKLSYLAFGLTVFDWVMAAFSHTHFLEWIMVALMLLFVAAISVRSARASAAGREPGEAPGQTPGTAGGAAL